MIRPGTDQLVPAQIEGKVACHVQPARHLGITEASEAIVFSVQRHAPVVSYLSCFTSVRNSVGIVRLFPVGIKHSVRDVGR